MRFLSKSTLFFLSIFSPFLAFADNGFQITPSSLTFTAQLGKGVDSQQLNVATTTGSAVSYSVAISSGQSGCYKLSVYPINGITPATLTVGAETQSLPANNYSCTLTISTNAQGGGFSSTVPVTMTVGGGGTSSGGLNVSPTNLNLAVATGFASAGGTITLTNTGSNPISYTAGTSQTWLSVSPMNGTVTSSTSLTVTANGTGMSAGTYTGNVIITPSGGSAILVQVALTVSSGPSVQLQRNGSAVTSVAFAYQIGTSLPADQTFSLVSSDATPIACTISQSTATSYLTITGQGSGYTPMNIRMALNSNVGTLSSGVYQTNLIATCLGASNQNLNIPVTLTVSAVPLLTIGTTPSVFSYQPGGSLPATQFVQLATTSNVVAYSVQISYSSGNGWLGVTPASGTTSAVSPVTLALSISPQNLTAGNYSATVAIYSSGAGNSPLSFPVTLNVGGSSGSLSAQPSSLTFNYQLGQALPPTQNVNLTSGSTTLAFTASALSQNCPGIFGVAPSSGSTPMTLTVAVLNIGIQTPQVCSGQVSVATGGGATLSIPLTATVSTSAVLQAYPNSMSFTGTLGDGSQTTRSFAITTSDGVTSLPVTVSSSASWLTVSPTSGNAPLTITASVNTSASGLQVGDNQATISVVANGSTISIPVVVTLTSSTTVAANPGNLAFTQPYGGASPAAQNVSLTLGGSAGVTTLPYSITIISGGTTNWITITPITGNVPGTFSVSVNGTGLPMGTYNATLKVTVTGASNSPLSIPLAFTVTQPATVAVTPLSLSFSAAAGSSNPAPQALQVSSSGGTLNFTATTSVSSCGNFLSVAPNSGTATTTAVNVNVSVNVSGLAPGPCSGSVIITGVGSNAITVPVSLTVTAPQPSVSSVVNAASFAPGAIAPGEIITLFGTNLGPATLALGSFNGTRFTTNVGGTQVVFDSGLYAPVIYSKDSQLSVVVPFEVAGRLQSNIQVLYNGQTSATVQMRVQDAAPGIFTTASSGSGQGSIVNQNGTINGTSAPAAKGSVVAVYLTGLGQTDPTGTTGAPGGTSPLQWVRSVTATIGNVPANVDFAGAAPTYIQGLYQVNLRVPDGVTAGSQPVSITINGVPTPSGVIMWVQ